jgi:hypothetical protein
MLSTLLEQLHFEETERRKEERIDRMKLIFTRSLNEPVAAAVLCPSMDLLAVATRKGFLSVYALSQQQPIFAINLLESKNSSDGPSTPLLGSPASGDGDVTCSSWTLNGRLLAVGFSSPLVCIVCVEKGEMLRRFRAQDVFEPSDHVLATRSGCWPFSLRTQEGVLLAAWNDHPVDQKMSKVGMQECLQIPPSRKTIAAILEDSWQQGTSAVLVLIGDRGTISVLIGGVREVWSRTVEFPDILRDSMRFHQTANSLIGEVAVSDGRGDVFFTIRTSSQAKGFPQQSQHAETVLVLPISVVLPELVHPIAVANCLIKEYEGIALTNFSSAASAWAKVVASTTAQFKLANVSGLLRDTLMDGLASPDQAALLQFLGDIQLSKVVSAAEALHKTSSSTASAVIGTSYVAFDQAIELSARTGMTGYSARIRGLKRCCGEFLSLMAKESQHYELLLRWLIVVIQAKTGVTPASDPVLAQSKSLFLQPPLASQHIHILRLLNALAALFEPSLHEAFVAAETSQLDFLNCANRYSALVSKAAAAHWSEEDVSSSFALRSSTSFVSHGRADEELRLLVVDWSLAIRSASVTVRSVTFFVAPDEEETLHVAVLAGSGGDFLASGVSTGASASILLASFALSGGAGLELACGPSPMCSELSSWCTRGAIGSGYLDGTHVVLALREGSAASSDGVTILRAHDDGSPFISAAQEDGEDDARSPEEQADAGSSAETRRDSSGSVLKIDGLRTGGGQSQPKLRVCAARGFAVVSCGAQVAVIDFNE